MRAANPSNPLLPCATCPWRKDKTAETIPRYNHAKACNLIHTVGQEDAFRPIMACHHSTEEDAVPCYGYLAMAGWSNINVRILLSQREIPNPDTVSDACEAAGIELHPDYASVLEKLQCSMKVF